MRLDGALSIATGGLANVSHQLAVVSQNVANASTPGYAAEIATQQSVTADGEGLGVRTGLTIRNLDATLQSELFSQNATVAELQTRQAALQAIDVAQGTPGQGADIASLLGNLQDQFSTCSTIPAVRHSRARLSRLRRRWRRASMRSATLISSSGRPRRTASSRRWQH